MFINTKKQLKLSIKENGNQKPCQSIGTTDSHKLHNTLHTVTILSIILCSSSASHNQINGKCTTQNSVFLSQKPYNSLYMNPYTR